jgi:deoxyribodipyrimidine photo-lyase
MQLVWFRRDLRVLDNHALSSAMARGEPVAALYTATPEQWLQHNLSPRQSDLIYRRLDELRKQLAALNIPLIYAQVSDYSAAARHVSQVAQKLGIENDTPDVTIHINREYELNERQRDSLLVELTELSHPGQPHCRVVSYHDRCAFPPGSVKKRQGGDFRVFTPFKRCWMALFIARPANALPLPPPCHAPRLSKGLPLFSLDSPWHYPRQHSDDYPVSDDAILHRLSRFLHRQLSAYDELRDYPALAGTSHLSPYLAIGALSVRQCLQPLQDPARNDGAEKWLDELIWREFYQHLTAAHPGLSKGESFHPWADKLQWPGSDRDFAAWCEGRTGYPIVDAAMRQLCETGWMHNRLRMITASFLVKDLLMDWRRGEAFFSRQLTDIDYASNNGGWQWCASTGCDGQPYFRIFNPVNQGERFDPEGAFVRRWLPELTEVPDRYIHQPWRWDKFTELNYPPPIVDHKVQRKLALALYQQAKDG